MKTIFKKSLGQNWLINPHILDKIVDTAEITSNDLVLEIGPGTGNLTKILAKKAGQVIAIEKDYRLIKALEDTFKHRANVKIIEADILKFDYTKYNIQDTRYKIVGNIPYYITSNLLRDIFEKWPTPELIVLTIQKEVAQRIMARPPHMNLLALSVQYYAKPKIISYISKNNFRPVPKVDSAIIKLVLRDKHQVLRGEGKNLFPLIKVGFSEKRKQLAGVLSKKLGVPKEKIFDIFDKMKIKKDIRAENLSLEQWELLNLHLFK